MTLVVNGDTNSTSSAMYEIGFVRDAAGHVVGYSGTATLLATAPDADRGLDYTSTGVLLYTAWPTNSVGQIKPGSTAPDRIDDLTLLGVTGTTGCDQLVSHEAIPLTLPQAGESGYRFAIPNAGTFAGLPLYHQFLQFAVTPQGEIASLSASSGLRLVVGAS